VWYRPGLLQFLEHASKFCEIVIFSSGCSTYVNSIVRKLDPNGEYINRSFNSDHLTYYEFEGDFEDGDEPGEFKIKDITPFITGEHRRHVSKIIIVDDLIHNFPNYLSNVIPIARFEGSADDQELLKLLAFLQRLAQEENPVAEIKRRFDLRGQVDSFIAHN
jgi:TFIIF-interacting CTD phosphatase-like protein